MTDTTAISPSAAEPETMNASQDGPQHRYDGGRRFHNGEDVAYVLPNDAGEDDRLHLQHWAIKLAFGSNFDAPVHQALEDGTKVLDSACGPATWTLEMASVFPNSRFYGTDISSRFPDQIKPANCEFVVHNIVNDPPFEEDYFGYIHQRLVILGIKAVDWPKVLKNLKTTLKPGGWVELTETSYSGYKNLGPNGVLLNAISDKMLSTAGLDPEIGVNLSSLMSDAGFTNIQARSIDIPINHGGKVGELFWEDFREGFSSIKPVLEKIHTEFQAPGVYEKFVKDLGEECKNIKSTTRWTRTIGQKPVS